MQKPHARIIHSDASRRMSDAFFLFRWNYAGKTSLSNCIGVSVMHIVIVAKTTGIRPNVPIIRHYTVYLQEIRPRCTINGSRQRESACDAVTVDRYGFSYRWFFNRDTSKSTPRKCLSETRYDVSLTRVYVTRGVDVREETIEIVDK